MADRLPTPLSQGVERTKVVALNGKELNAVATFFAEYIHGEADAEMTLGAITDMKEGWEGLKKEVGKETALQIFWCWNNTRPQPYRSDVDPDGN